jgi:hypothetical protein
MPMTSRLTDLSTLRRPRLLIRAARHGMNEYRRERTLARLVEGHGQLSPDETLHHLLQAEARIEAERTSGQGTYSVTRHVEVLIAMMAEARLALRPTPSAGDA